MTAVVVVFVVGLVAAVAVAALARAAWQARSAATTPWLTRTTDGLVDLFGTAGAALAIITSGATAIVAVLWPLGAGLARLETTVDQPIYDWMHDRLTRGSWWTKINELLTQSGNNRQIQVLCVVASVVLGVLWRRRSWWLPAVAIIVTYWGERYVQKVLGSVVDRGHPPTTLGTYPSGGCGRLISVGGVVLLLVGLTFPHLSRRVKVGAWSVLALAAYIEGFSRTYLLKHWFTDVIGGWLFGVMLLAVFGSATVVLCSERRRNDGSPVDAHGVAVSSS